MEEVTTNGNNDYRIFVILPASDQAHGMLFAIQDINLVNGKASLNNDERGGGAFYSFAFGLLKVIKVDFENNPDPLSASDDCGAVHTILYKEALSANCNFKNNNGANVGAVGTIDSAMTFINCLFN